MNPITHESERRPWDSQNDTTHKHEVNVWLVSFRHKFLKAGRLHRPRTLSPRSPPLGTLPLLDQIRAQEVLMLLRNNTTDIVVYDFILAPYEIIPPYEIMMKCVLS